MLKSLFGKPAPKPTLPQGQVSYAQCGEDLIASFLFDWIRKPCQSYLDIGASDPVHMNNTYFFYQRGVRGVCVEPDPTLAEQLRQARPDDHVINAGVSGKEMASSPFYVMMPPTLNTFCKEDAQKLRDSGKHDIERVIDVPLHSPAGLLEKASLPKAGPDLFSLDVEGLNYEIVSSIDFASFRPAVIIVETLSYEVDGTERRLTEIIDHLEKADYLAYADTFINTVFVDQILWANRNQ